VRAAESVLFTSWQGLFYSDNPRAIAEALWRSGAPYELVWIVAEQTGPVPDWVRTVPRGSAAHLAELERARYIVANDTVHDVFRKRPDARYLQTWHGTPLKRIAYDVERPHFAGAGSYLPELARDVARWDWLLSPNRFSTEVLRHAFRFEGEVLETGYPRNDLLNAPEREEIRAAVREQLGIADGVQAVLYAPTWRDGDPFTLALDLERVARSLGDGYAVMFRAHWHAFASPESRAVPGALDLTEWQDLRQLYLAADVLVTDYSSAMFDFAVTGKPLLYYTYDLERYRDVLRGFYFDFEAEAPGPLLTRTEEVVAALEDLDAVERAYAGPYARFRERFCHLDDGHASERVIDAVFEGLPAATGEPVGVAS